MSPAKERSASNSANGKTVMHYAGDARIGGKIAAVGQRLLDVAAKQIAKQSLKKLSKQVETPSGDGGVIVQPTMTNYRGEAVTRPGPQSNCR